MRPILLSLCVLLPVLAQESKYEEHGKFEEHNKRIRESTQVLDEVMGAGDKGIPRDLLRKAQCVGIVPNLKRAGFVIGGQYGKGVLTCRVPEQTGWSAVSTIRVEGGSIGLQIGAGETDLIFIVMNQSGMDRLMKDKFTIGADASVMAGPVGRSADAHTDALMKAEILAYSRSRGIFGGVSLQGATLRPDKDDNAKLYGHPVSQERILHGEVKPTEETYALYDELNRWAPFKKS
jgi:lipid-binding SYLF domain-containing protein